MDKASQEEVIKKYSRKLEKLCRKIPGSFEEEDIHQWRVEYKKLRAFLRMITAAKEGPGQLMGDEIKEIYKAAGEIRNIQLFISYSRARLPEYLLSTPVYFTLIQQALFSAKENFMKHIERFSFDKEKENWYGCLPDYLGTEQIKQFVQENVSAIRIILLVPMIDENLHSVRKHLKDIIYNIHTFGTFWGIPFPVIAWKNEKKMSEAALDLGNFMDSCNRLFFLNTTYTDLLPAGEKNVLRPIQQNWNEEKNTLQARVTEKVKQLDFLPDCKEN